MKRLGALYACILVVMVGFGIALPLMPLFVERLALANGASSTRVAFHIGALTAAYPLTQLVFAPLWGRLSDRIGRRPLLVVGLVGFALSQVLFGIARGLELLYVARLVGGALSSALMPAASAYVSDLTSEQERTRGIVRLNTSVGIGTIVGPAIGALLVQRDWHVRALSAHIVFDGFSLPFLAAGLLAVAALGFALVSLPESRTGGNAAKRNASGARERVSLLLCAVFATYLGIAAYEATFALFARDRLGFGAGEVAAAFTLCGVMMIVAQLAISTLARRVGNRTVIAFGLGAMAMGLLALVLAAERAFAYVAVALLGAGMALAGSVLSAEVSRHRAGDVGAIMGIQQSVQGLGQVVGALIGTLLFDWHAASSYVGAAMVLAMVGIAVMWRGTAIRAPGVA